MIIHWKLFNFWYLKICFCYIITCRVCKIPKIYSMKSMYAKKFSLCASHLYCFSTFSIDKFLNILWITRPIFLSINMNTEHNSDIQLSFRYSSFSDIQLLYMTSFKNWQPSTRTGNHSRCIILYWVNIFMHFAWTVLYWWVFELFPL